MNVKRIVFKTWSVGMCSAEDMFMEKLTVTENGISYDWKTPQPFAYERKQSKEIRDPESEWAWHKKWSYKTNHPEFPKDMKRMAKIIEKFIEEITIFSHSGPGSMHAVILTLEDGRKIKKEYDDDYGDLQGCFEVMVRWLPTREIYLFEEVTQKDFDPCRTEVWDVFAPKDEG